MWEYVHASVVAQGDQKRASHLLKLVPQVVVNCHGCWELYWGPLREHRMLFMTVPSLQHHTLSSRATIVKTDSEKPLPIPERRILYFIRELEVG